MRGANVVSTTVTSHVCEGHFVTRLALVAMAKGPRSNVSCETERVAQKLLRVARRSTSLMKLTILLAAGAVLAGVAAAACSGDDASGAGPAAGGGADASATGATDATTDAAAAPSPEAGPGGPGANDGASPPAPDGSLPGSGADGGPSAPDGGGPPAPDAGVTVLIVDNPGGLDSATQGKLRAGGNGDPSFAWLYPYDATVFPLDIASPSLQWSGASADAYYVRVTTGGETYEVFYGPGAPAIALDSARWSALEASAAPSASMRVEATVLRGGVVTGPRPLAFTIAPAALPGVIYYSELGGALRSGDGAVMKLRPAAGAVASVVAGQTACTGCHSVSTDGTTMIVTLGPDDTRTGSVLNLANGNQDVRDPADATLTWGALTPDGARMMSNGAIDDGYPPNVSGQARGPRPSRLYDVKAGALVPTIGWDTSVTYALMPSFSPLGNRIAFNHYDTGNGHSLATMGFDPATATFSALTEIASDPSSYVAWPAFTSDGVRVVYQVGSRQDYATEQGGKGDLWITSSTATAPARLAQLDGADMLSFLPSLSPDQAGGFEWVAFTSRRTYGNTILTSSQDDDIRQKIWIAAIDARAGALDPSHPPFLLAGQEMPAANMRPVWTRGN